MTSKSLYFNMIREDMKRRIWTISLAMLAFFIAIPTYTMLRLDRMKYAMEHTNAQDAYQYFAKMANTNNQGIFLITIVGAVICAINGYFYLYSKSKMDFFHGLPVKREKLFISSYLNGIFIYFIPYVINLIIYFFIGAANKFLTGNAIKGAFTALLINLLGFLLIYSISIIAVMLTGNLIVGLLGTAVFMFYGPALLFIKMSLCEAFFDTYTYYQQISDDEILSRLSPIFAYSYMSSIIGEKKFFFYLIGILILTVIAIIVSLYLYKIRPSEAAGKSMAFYKTQAVIKTLIVIPIAMVGGLLFMGMSESNAFSWMIFGILLTGALAHGIIEIIYNSDFKSIISNKLNMGICIILSVCIALLVKFDLIKYDSYIPSENNVESLSVSFSSLEPNLQYYDFYNEYDDSNSYQYYNYIDATQYQLDHIKIPNLEYAYPLIQYAVNNNIGNNYSYTSQDDDDVYTSFIVKYVLNNGKETYRQYTVKLEDVVDYIKELYNDENYKLGVYQILSLDNSFVNSISYFNMTEGRTELLNMTKEQMNEFMEIYKADLKNLSGTELLEEIPATLLEFTMGQEENAINKNVIQTYYVYSSFTKTLEYMKSLGANLDSNINSDNIESITITKPILSDSSDIIDNKEYVFTDKKEIEEITDALILDIFARGTKYNMDIDYNLGVDIEYKFIGNNTNAAYLIMNKLPDNIKEQIGE